MSESKVAVATVAVIMGSDSDWPSMQHAVQVLKDFGIAYECKVVSAHRTPDYLVQFASEAASRGLQIIIAGAGGAAHLPGMVAAHTILPVIGVPIKSSTLFGVDSLLSIVQMPGGVPVATMAIGNAGAKNAGLMAARIIGLHDAKVATQVARYHESEKERVLKIELPAI
jgi:5-(carboxyamino)imidazole ribonucleotide mutase